MTISTLRCEKCGQELGVELLQCSYQSSGRCPYRIERSQVISGGFRWIFLILGLGFASAGFFFLPFGIIFTLFGLVFALIGAFMGFGNRVVMFNKTTGRMWQRMNLFGYGIFFSTTSAFETVPFEVRTFRQPSYPVSISALCRHHQKQNRSKDEWSEYGVDLFYRTLLSLLGREVIRLRYASASNSFFGRPPTVKTVFAVTPGERVSGALVRGELETRIVEAVKRWSQQTDSTLRAKNYYFVREMTHCLVLKDLLFLVLDGKHANPAQVMITELVGSDADRQGIGHLSGRFIKRFELFSQYRDSLCADYQIMQETHEQWTSAHPKTVSELRESIRDAFKSCVDSD